MQKQIKIQRKRSEEIEINGSHPSDHLDSLSYLNHGIVIGTFMFLFSLAVKVFQNS